MNFFPVSFSSLIYSPSPAGGGAFSQNIYPRVRGPDLVWVWLTPVKGSIEYANIAIKIGLLFISKELQYFHNIYFAARIARGMKLSIFIHINSVHGLV